MFDFAGERWKCIRVEKDAEKELDGWIFGRFNPNSFGSDLNGFWQVRRFPLRGISSIYQTYQLIVNPVTEKLANLARGESLKG